PLAGGVEKPSSTGAPDQAFRVDKTAAAAPASALEKLRSGDITMSQYLDAKVDEATSHLAGKLAPDQLEFVRANLREQLASDPILVDWVKGATGSAPRPAE